jgi:hypothetical protein
MNMRAGEYLAMLRWPLVSARHLASYCPLRGSMPRLRVYDFAVGPRPAVRKLAFQIKPTGGRAW